MCYHCIRLATKVSEYGDYGHDGFTDTDLMDDHEWDALMADRMAQGLNMGGKQIRGIVGQGWQKGTRGKGYTMPDGTAVEWSVNEADAPHHQQVMQEFAHPQHSQAYHIAPNGTRVPDEDYLQGVYPELADDWDFPTV